MREFRVEPPRARGTAASGNLGEIWGKSGGNLGKIQRKSSENLVIKTVIAATLGLTPTEAKSLVKRDNKRDIYLSLCLLMKQ